MNIARVKRMPDQGLSNAWSEWHTRWRGARFDGATRHGRKLRLLVFTSLYPNAAQPRHGVFVEERLRHLLRSGRIEATVVAPVPWFPFRHRRFGAYADFANVPAHERRHDIEIIHPRYPVLPKIGMRIAPSLLVHAMLPVLRTMRDRFDLIDAHYLYPDGVAAARLGELLDKPVVITARGSDVTVIPRYRHPRRQIQWASEHVAAIVTVSRHLQDKLVALGVDRARTTVLRNGVDLDRFRPLQDDAIRARLNVHGPIWLTVGHLIELKGVHIAIDALARVAHATLLVVGEGPCEAALRKQAQRLGMDGRVRFLGALGHDELCRYYNAADVLVHASSREGMPNVVLEALACGTPVVAAPFDGVRELLDAPEAGEVAVERSPDAIAKAWQRLQARAPTRAATRAHAQPLGWAPVMAAQERLYAHVVAHRTCRI